MNKVKQILQWYTEGVPKLTISQRAGVSRNSVKSYIRQFIAMDRSLEELLSMKDADLEKLFLSRQFNKYYRQGSARANSTMHIEHKAGDKIC